MVKLFHVELLEPLSYTGDRWISSVLISNSNFLIPALIHLTICILATCALASFDFVIAQHSTLCNKVQMKVLNVVNKNPLSTEVAHSVAQHSTSLPPFSLHYTYPFHNIQPELHFV
eukprot:TRINITY_DN13458_c0_g1_i19.p1 TRINITY_DN13458_c0_g1~~TRINITY_DN13458_c0_g1_i19.p1  ORF type:complete len:116 (-),score=6.98 TRINITY_DN13458_c0_g1_i19:767-1114(-)